MKKFYLIILLFLLTGCSSMLVITGKDGVTNYPLDSGGIVRCWEKYNENGTPRGCCCNQPLPDRGILDIIHRCAH